MADTFSPTNFLFPKSAFAYIYSVLSHFVFVLASNTIFPLNFYRGWERMSLTQSTLNGEYYCVCIAGAWKDREKGKSGRAPLPPGDWLNFRHFVINCWTFLGFLCSHLGNACSSLEITVKTRIRSIGSCWQQSAISSRFLFSPGSCFHKISLC